MLFKLFRVAFGVRVLACLPYVAMWMSSNPSSHVLACSFIPQYPDRRGREALRRLWGFYQYQLLMHMGDQATHPYALRRWCHWARRRTQLALCLSARRRPRDPESLSHRDGHARQGSYYVDDHLCPRDESPRLYIRHPLCLPDNCGVVG